MMPALEQVVPEPGDSAPKWFQWALSRKAESCFVEANGNRLHYFAWNMQDANKPLLLFVHGFLAHARWWDFIAPYFMNTHRVIAMDLSGMGESGWREAYSAPQLAHDVTSLIEALGLGPATAIAHSYGGLCALCAASERPELFNRVIAIDTYVAFETAQRPRDPARITQSRVYPDYATARKRYRLLPDQPVPLKCLVDHVAQHSVREVEGGLRWKFDRRLQGPGMHLHDGEGMLGRVSVPVDYIYGERSSLIDALHASRVTSALPNVRGPVAIPDGHHHLMLDQPIALISTLRGLLEQQKIRHE